MNHRFFDENWLDTMLADRKRYHQALLERPQSLGELLAYDEYLPDHQVFVQKDGSLGAVFELALLSHEPMTEKEIIRAVSETKPWLTLPFNCVLGFHYECQEISQLDAEIGRLEDRRKQGHPVAKLLYSEKVGEIKASCGGGSDRGPLRRRLFVSLRYFPAGTKKGGSDVLNRETLHAKRVLAEFDSLVKGFSGDSEFELRRLDGEALADYLRRFFNPRSCLKRSFAPVNPRQSLSKQIIFSTPKLDHSGIERQGVRSRTVSLKTSPSFCYPGGMAYFSGLDFAFRLNIVFTFPEKGKVKKFFDTKEFFLENAVSARARLQREEIQAIQERLAREDQCLHMTFNVTVESETTDELDEKTRRVCQIFHQRLESEVIEEDAIGLGLCLATLPLGYVPDADYSTKRAIRILRSDAMKFLPIFGSFRGLKEPLGIYQSRERELVPFSLLENETSNHTVVLADTGAGKSALVIDLLQSVKRLEPEPLVFVIDKKSSYGMLSRYFDGDLTVFDRSSEKIPFSPFRGIYNDEKFAFLAKMLVTAVKLVSPSFDVESEHQTAILRALKTAHRKKREQLGLDYVDGEFVRQETSEQVAIDMNDVVSELGSLGDGTSAALSQVIEDLVVKLRPFYGDGTYARYFTAGDSLPEELEQRFFVYDLDALDGDPVLQSLMTMSVIEEIRSILALPINKGRTGFIVLEEFAMLGRNNPAFRDFAIDFAETMRKRGCWLITLTPRPQNYFELEVGRAFWGVADNFIFLQMSSDNVDFVSKHSTLFDEANTEIIRSLRTKKGQYADVYYMNKSKTKQGAFRYRQTAYDRWMSPTNATDQQAVDRALQRFPDKWQALKHLVTGGDECAGL